MNIYAEMTDDYAVIADLPATEKVIRANFCRIDLCIDLFKFYPEILTDIVMKKMTQFRGIQFVACGSIFLQGEDAKIPFEIEPRLRKKYGISKLGPITTPHTGDLHGKGTLILLRKGMLRGECFRLMTMIINRALKKNGRIACVKIR